MNKTELEKKSEKFTHDIEEQVDIIQEKAQKYGKQALIIGGGVFLAYQVVKLMTKSSSKKNDVDSYYEEHNGEKHKVIVREVDSSPGFFDNLKAEVSAVLLAMARKKLISFLNQLQTPGLSDGESNTEEAE
jgi:hypothetical protein